MHGVLQVALAVLSVSVALAAPTSNGLVKRSFQAKTNGRGVSKNILDEINRTHRKFGWEIIVIGSDNSFTTTIEPSSPVFITSTIGSGSSTIGSGTSAIATSSPPSSSSAPYGYGNGTKSSSSSIPISTGAGAGPGSEDGSVAADPEQDEQAYTSPITIGGQKVNLDFDTGSSDLWVYSNKLTKKVIGKHSIYDESKSTTWQPLDGATWEITYGDNSGARGFVGYDIVDVGGSTVKKQAIELATSISGTTLLNNPQMDGLLGLGFSTLNTVKPKQQTTFFENVREDLSEPVFTADLEEVGGKGTYDFGSIDKTKYSGDIHYTPVNSTPGYWAIAVPAYTIAGKQRPCTTCSVSIVDTGTTLMYVDQDVYDDYFSNVKTAIGDAWGSIYNCSEELPEFGIQIGDFMATLSGKDMVYSQNGDGTCNAAIQASTLGMQIIGDTFLKQFFAVFDGTKGKERFGIATKDGDGAATAA